MSNAFEQGDTAGRVQPTPEPGGLNLLKVAQVPARRGEGSPRSEIEPGPSNQTINNKTGDVTSANTINSKTGDVTSANTNNNKTGDLTSQTSVRMGDVTATGGSGGNGRSDASAAGGNSRSDTTIQSTNTTVFAPSFSGGECSESVSGGASFLGIGFSLGGMKPNWDCIQKHQFVQVMGMMCAGSTEAALTAIKADKTLNEFVKHELGVTPGAANSAKRLEGIAIQFAGGSLDKQALCTDMGKAVARQNGIDVLPKFDLHDTGTDWDAAARRRAEERVQALAEQNKAEERRQEINVLVNNNISQVVPRAADAPAHHPSKIHHAPTHGPKSCK